MTLLEPADIRVRRLLRSQSYPTAPARPTVCVGGSGVT